MDLDKDVLTQSEAAEYINEHPRYEAYMGQPKLSRLHNAGDGPNCTKKGNSLLYHVDDLDDWIRQKS